MRSDVRYHVLRPMSTSRSRHQSASHMMSANHDRQVSPTDMISTLLSTHAMRPKLSATYERSPFTNVFSTIQACSKQGRI